MAKEQLHSWGRFILLGIFIVFATGGWVVKVLSNTSAIADVKAESKKIAFDVEEVEDDVVDLKLQYKDIENLSTQTVNVLQSINTKLDSVQKTQTEQAIVQAVNSVKLKTLTKD